MRIEEEYFDILQNIESTIVTAHDDNPDLVDRDVLKAIEMLKDEYELERRGRDGVVRVPTGRSRAVYNQCRRICEWRLGRQPLNEGESNGDDVQPGELSVAEVVLCLKWLRKSIRMWHKQGGRQGYLTYVRQFIADANTRLHT